MALDSRGIGYRRAVEEFDLHAHFAHFQKVCSGERFPCLELAIDIERAFGVPVDQWPNLRGPVSELLRLRGKAAA